MAQAMVFPTSAAAAAPQQQAFTGYVQGPGGAGCCGACGGPLKTAVCQKGQNAGKTYSVCANGAGPFCKKSFKWVDAPIVAVAAAGTQPPGAVASGWPTAAPVAGAVTLQNVYDELQLLKVEVARLTDTLTAQKNVMTD